MKNSFAFASSFGDEKDKELLEGIIDDAKRFVTNFQCECIFLKDFESNDDVSKAKTLISTDVFLIPTWIELNDEVKKEITLAKKLGVQVRLFSHWLNDDLKSVYEYFNLPHDGQHSFAWNRRMLYL